MLEADKPKFANLLTAICVLHNRKLSPELLAMFWHVLKKYDYAQIQNAMNVYISNPDIGQFMVKPADIIAIIEGKSSTRAARAWSKVLWGIQHVGAWDSVEFDDHKIHAVIMDMGGWTYLCRSNTSELPFLAREFERLYAIEITEGGKISPARLSGKLEQVTAYCNGNAVNETRFIGDKSINSTLMQLSHNVCK